MCNFPIGQKAPGQGLSLFFSTILLALLRVFQIVLKKYLWKKTEKEGMKGGRKEEGRQALFFGEISEYINHELVVFVTY